MTTINNTLLLTPSWKAFFGQYLLGILLTPFLLGIYILWRTYRTQSRISYTITDQHLTVVDGHISQNIDLDEITRIKTSSMKLGVGSVFVETTNQKLALIGIESPPDVANALKKDVQIQ